MWNLIQEARIIGQRLKKWLKTCNFNFFAMLISLSLGLGRAESTLIKTKFQKLKAGLSIK